MFIYTLGDMVFGFIIGVSLLILLIGSVWDYFKKLVCSHKRTYEDMGCNEICRDCGKSLGFIGRGK